MKTRYRNTDLDLHSTEPLNDLSRHLEAAGLVVLGHHPDGQGDWMSVLEIIGDEEDRFHVNADATVVAMLDVLEQLPPSERQMFDQCTLREFNAAYDVGDKPLDFNEGLSAKTISRMAALNMSLRITLYPGDERRIAKLQRPAAFVRLTRNRSLRR